jgi:hypothetical protein
METVFWSHRDVGLWLELDLRNSSYQNGGFPINETVRVKAEVSAASMSRRCRVMLARPVS